ncbi:MAG: glycosyltransferase [Candidatus Eremiobacteraeota bacterium]|nr:glycosyltransferase [Candidatus Eremiobacteraeota bacterium]
MPWREARLEMKDVRPLQIGYFLEQSPAVSETFILDLLTGLAQRGPLTTLVGRGKDRLGPGQVYTGHADLPEGLLRKSYLLGKLWGKGFQLENRVRKLLVSRRLRNLPSTVLPQVALVDYLHHAATLAPFLRRAGIPFLAHVHGWDITYKLSNPAFRADLPELFASAAYLIAASHHMRRLLILNGCPEEKIRVIRIGIDVGKISPLPWDERTPHPSVIFLGRLTPKKNPVALIHAFGLVCKSLPEASLTIIGEGPCRGECLEAIRRLNLNNNVTLLGSLPREQAFPLLARHWLFAQHSVTSLTGDQEGFAISPAEAAGHEVPVVSTWHNGIPEHVIHGQTGYLVQEFDFEAMGRRMLEVLQNRPLAEQMGRNGRKQVQALCQPGQRIKEFSDLLNSLALRSKS